MATGRCYNERVKRVFRVLLIGTGLFALGTLSALVALAWQVNRYGQIDEAQKADAIVVLGARVQAGGRPGSDLLSRTYHALDLYQAGYAEHLICTGGFKDDPLSAAAVACRFAIENGVPPDRIRLAEGAMNTEEDAASAARVMRANGWQSAIIVSHPLHLYRVAWHFHRQGIEVFTSPTTTDVNRIMLPLRIYYTAREAVAIALSQMDHLGLPDAWTTKLQVWWHRINQSILGENL